MQSSSLKLSSDSQLAPEFDDHSLNDESVQRSASIEGRDGWLFSADTVNRLSAGYSESSNSLVDWRDELTQRSNRLAARGARFLHVFTPDKVSLYGDRLDAYLQEREGQTLYSPLKRFSSRFRADLPCLIDPTAYLQRQTEQHSLFWRADTRWTPWSAFMTCQLLCSRLNVAVNSMLLGYPYNEAKRLMNLDGDVLPEQAELIRSYRFSLRSKRRYANDLVQLREQTFGVGDRRRTNPEFAQGAYTVFENRHPDAVQRCLLVFGNENAMDSRTLLTGMLAETFSEVHFVWGSSIDYELVEKIHPDVVITQSNELQLLDKPDTEFNSLALASQSLSRLQEWTSDTALKAQSQQHFESTENKKVSALSSDTVQKVLLTEERYFLDKPGVVQSHSEVSDADTLMRSNEVVLQDICEAELYFNGPSWWVHDGKGREVVRHNIPDTKSRPMFWRRGKRLPGTALLFATSAGAHCYYHWMLEIFPKLGLLEREGVDLGTIDHFLVREITGQWQLETLERFGIDRSRIVETVKQPQWRAERLLHIHLNCGINLKMHRFIPLWMKHLYPSAQSTKTRMKLYITRPEGVRRGIANEDEFLPYLEESGFTIMAMEGLSVAEQAELLSRVDVLISPHGGALTNMVFCRPGIDVVEIFSRHVFPYYYGLAANCGHRYHAVLENPEEDYPRLVNSKIAQSYANNQHLTADQSFDVPVDALKQTLQKLNL